MKFRIFGIAMAVTLALGLSGTAFADDELDAVQEPVEAAELTEDSESEDAVLLEEVDEAIELEIAAGDPSLNFSESTPCAFTSGMTIDLSINDAATDRTYKLVWQRNGSWKDGEWGVINGPDAAKTGIVWSPAKPGSYKIWLDWSEDGFATSSTTTFTFDLTEDYTYEKAAASPDQFCLVGNPIDLNAVVSGNTANLEYKFVWTYNGSWADGNWGVVKAFDSTNAATFTPTKGGTYTFYVDVADASGSTTTKTVKVKVDSLGAECVQGTEVPFSPGVKLDLKALAGPGAYDNYKFVWSYNGSWKSGNWGVVQAMSPSDTATWKPEKAGKYKIYVDGQDSKGNTYTVTLDVTLTEDWTFESITANPESPQTIKTAEEALITCNTSGNNAGLQYKFVWQKNGSWKDGNWGVLQAPSPSNTATFKWGGESVSQFGIGHYTIYVDIIDTQGNITTKTYNYEISKRWTWNGFSLSALEQDVNKPVTITAVTGADNAGLEYKFVWQKNGSWRNGYWGVLQDWSTSNTAVMTPDTPGDFTIYVDIRDVDGSMESFNTTSEGKTYYAYKLSGLGYDFEAATGGIELAVVLYPDWGSSHAPSGFTYTYRWEGGGQSGTIATDTTKTRVAWVPTANTFDYTFYLDVTSPENVTTTYKKKVTLPTGGDYRYSGGTYWSIVVDRNQHWLVVYENYGNKIRYIWRCTNGADATPTPTGWYSIQSKLYYFDSDYGIRCFYASGFIGQVYLIHSTLYNQPASAPTEEYVRDPTLGAALSHGCVRIAVENARWVYNNIPYGTSVRIYDWYG